MANKGYYDIDIDFDVFMQSCGITDLFWLKDAKLRKFYLNDGVDQESIHEIARHILQINAEDDGVPVEERKPIRVYIASNGGSVVDGFELIDVIESSVTPVYTIVLANAYSMGFLISLCGHKRFAMKSASFLHHDGSNLVWDSGTKAQDQMAFNKRFDDRIKAYVISHSNITEDEYDSKLRVEWYMFANEAKEKGFTDYIIGEDCALSEVI